MNRTGLTQPEDAELPPLPLTLRASRLKGALLLLVCLVFTVIGVWMGMDTHEWVGWACAALFGAGCVIFIVNMLPDASYLRLEEDGFTYSSLFRQQTVTWAVTVEFGVMAIQRSKMVGWSFVPNHQMNTTMRKVNRALAGFDAALPDTYGMKAMDLAVLMATLRDHYWQQHGLTEKDVDGGALQPVSDNAAWAGDSRGLQG